LNIFEQQSRILITCPLRVVPYLKIEIESLGYTVVAETLTHVEIFGSMNDAMIMNLLLRTAHRILFFVQKFIAKNPDELYSNFRKIHWEDYISPDSYISISSAVEHPSINDSRYPNQKCKDAIVDRMRSVFGRRPDSGSKREGALIYFYWKENVCQLFFDTSGVSLSKRNYRKLPFLAPMQETLAAATLLATNWKGIGNLINPMCGSGTIAIEAALIALNMCPGSLRNNFSFMHLIGFDKSNWDVIKKKFCNQKKNFTARIIATDISSQALFAAKQNAKNAGVDDIIEFHQCDFRDTIIPDGGGVVFLNPEYGERLGDENKLASIYSGIGDFFKNKCQGYTGYVFTGNFNLAKKIGLRTKQRIPFFNGSIDCRLLEYELYTGSKKNKFI